MSSYILLRVCWAQKPAEDLFLLFPAAVESSLCTRGEVLPPMFDKLNVQRGDGRRAAALMSRELCEVSVGSARLDAGRCSPAPL